MCRRARWSVSPFPTCLKSSSAQLPGYSFLFCVELQRILCMKALENLQNVVKYIPTHAVILIGIWPVSCLFLFIINHWESTVLLYVIYRIILHIMYYWWQYLQFVYVAQVWWVQLPLRCVGPVWCWICSTHSPSTSTGATVTWRASSFVPTCQWKICLQVTCC